MEIKTAEFVASFPRESMCPADGRPEFAFIGRSNVGKSSLINMLTRKGMAKVSATPGKTQLLNFFLINSTWYLVDLPGYGYARLSKGQRAGLAKMIDGYLLKRQTLALAFVLIDATLPPQPIDLEFINRLGEHQVPFALAFTKTDRIGAGKLEQHIAQFMQALSATWESLPPYFITSAERRVGKEEILDYIALGLRNS
ncbi:MAG TPA: ribosome biogenesis GTP-binding protein YihA/YsxC [Saprospiraceae bacterium]|nr:ribosome biogenesis GTP-binding protein YihA/YsxC [Saprospiraceae bacterium]HND90095.1 ribosome biogenesis GTP-binding protein YihA/YsxC [Saprospiraceae bacterium]HNG88651.1 ribosome biogenesis GTP-binding protein YihA/YsxC [Saprospiraceae bacterium]